MPAGEAPPPSGDAESLPFPPPTAPPWGRAASFRGSRADVVEEERTIHAPTSLGKGRVSIAKWRVVE